MIGLLCSVIMLLDTTSYCSPPPPINIEEGFFSQYAQLPTDGTINYRQETGQLPYDLSAYDGVIATSDCSLIGKDAWIRVNGGPWLRVIVFDCAGHAHTVSWMARDNILGELGFYLTQKLDIIGQGNIRGHITFDNPEEEIIGWQKHRQQLLSLQ